MRRALSIPVAILATIGARAVIEHFAGPCPFALGVLITLPITYAALYTGWAQR